MGQTTDEIRRRREIEARRRGIRVEDLNKNVRRKTSKKVMKRNKRRKAIKGLLAAIGIGAVAGIALLPSGNEKENKVAVESTVENTNTAHQDFVNKYKENVNTQEVIDKQQEDIYQTIVKKYNEQYPDADITIDDLGIIRSMPSDQLYKNGEQYIQDYDLDNEKYPDAESIDVYAPIVYMVIDKKNEKIPIAMTKINGEFEQVDVIKYIADTQQNPYTSQPITVDEENKEQMYEGLETKYNEVVQELEGDR